MFTGLVQGKGKITARRFCGGDLQLRIDTAALCKVALDEGESIAVNGVCLTATAIDGSAFGADVSNETLAATTLGTLEVGDDVNLERSLVLGQALGGHLVTGHVDGVGEILRVVQDGRSSRLQISLPGALTQYIAARGSVCVDGVSLTVNEVQGNKFSVNVVPHTMAVTTLGEYGPGTRVNIEVDIIARYLERLLQGREDETDGIDADLLERFGFGREHKQGQ